MTVEFYQIMGTQLNIKSADAYRLASELSELTGESLTAAVTAALRERLERERRARAVAEIERKAWVRDMLAIGHRLRSHMRPGTTSADHNEAYGPDGLPR